MYAITSVISAATCMQVQACHYSAACMRHDLQLQAFVHYAVMAKHINNSDVEPLCCSYKTRFGTYLSTLHISAVKLCMCSDLLHMLAVHATYKVRSALLQVASILHSAGSLRRLTQWSQQLWQPTTQESEFSYVDLIMHRPLTYYEEDM